MHEQQPFQQSDKRRHRDNMVVCLLVLSLAWGLATAVSNGTLPLVASVYGATPGQKSRGPAVASFPITIDATALPGRVRIVRIALFASKTVRTFHLPAGDYTFQHVEGKGGFPFTVTANGTLLLEPSVEEYVEGAGTATLIVRGVSIIIDATALGGTSFSIGDGIVLASQTPQLVTLLPVGYNLRFPHMVVSFSVQSDVQVRGQGKVDYAPTLETLLIGRGTNTMTLPDTDGDGVIDLLDNCPDIQNPLQKDSDADGQGDACADDDQDGVVVVGDPCPYDPDDDADGDGVCACQVHPSICQAQVAQGLVFDNCPSVANPRVPTWTDRNGVRYTNSQPDIDHNGVGDACDSHAGGSTGNAGVCTSNCSGLVDADQDGLESTHDPNDTNPDVDGDGIRDGVDNCVSVANANQRDTDRDGGGDACDPDDDNDGRGDSSDNCPRHANATQNDQDGDGRGDLCDEDRDGDTLTTDQEVALGTDPTKRDTDGDGLPDNTDPFPLIVGTPAYILSLEARDGQGTNITDTFLPVAGTSVRLVARLRNVATNALIAFPNLVNFTLTSTRLPGVATNDTEVAPTSNDYSFDATNKNVLTRSAPGGAITATVQLFAFDYGGQASITARTVAPNGQTLQVTLGLPKDSDGDRLPDAWENLYRSAGFDPFRRHALNATVADGDADVDTSLGNNFIGDGLTNFNEYRGILFGDLTARPASCPSVPGEVPETGHVRLNPMRKDLFVRGDNFCNSLPPNTAADVLPFSVFVPGGNAFANVDIAVHDVTGLGRFQGPAEPPLLDILVVTNVTNTTAALTDPLADGFIYHQVSSSAPRNWVWDTKGASYIGTATDYALFSDPAQNVRKQGTFVYHLNLMHYFSNRPYQDDRNFNASYQHVLDPIGFVEDRRLENGLGPERLSLGGSVATEDSNNNRGLDGDRKQTDWRTSSYGLLSYQVGYQFSVFDANGNGRIEHPPVTDALAQGLGTGGVREYTPLEVQIHTILHEMGHAVGMSKEHTSDVTDLMYNATTNWNRAGHFGVTSRGQIYIHNK